MSPMQRIILSLALAGALAGPAHAIIINTDSDSDNDADGVCSLREAIIAVNSNADYNECHGADGGLDYVQFSIPPNAGEVHTIALTEPLPTITHYVGFDASPQAGTSCAPLPNVHVWIGNPNQLASDALVFDTGSDYSSIGSIGVSGFQAGYGVVIYSTHVVLACSVLGTDTTGTSAVPNYGGVNVAGDYARIGLVDSLDWLPNLVSGNTFANVRVAPGVTGTLIAGNHIGVDVTGLVPLQSGYGIYDHGIGTQIGTGFTDGDPERQRNVIGVTDDGVSLSTDIEAQDTQGLVISGNYIGVGADGHTQLSSEGSRIQLNGTASGTLIGCDGNSTWDGCRNVIGNAVAGDSIRNFGSSGTAVVGNFIGIAADGVTPLPAGFATAGVRLAADALVARNRIHTGTTGIALDQVGAGPDSATFLNGIPAGSGGATLDSSGNCIDGNTGAGVVVTSGTPAATVFAGNWWGAADGPAPAGSGDSVSDNVTATPYLGAPSVYCGFDHIFGGNFE